MKKLPIKIVRLIERGALFFANNSGGKDSQAMYLYLKQMIPPNLLVVVHAALGEVEWPGTIEHIQYMIGDSHLHIALNPNKTLLEMVERRGMFPDKSRRQCTSDLKRDPISVVIRRVLREQGKLLAVNCMGMRADESTDRAKLKTFSLNKKLSKAGRECYDWLPIHNWTTNEVFTFIAEHGQVPHWAYSKGMTRLSCSFCIMSSQEDLCTAAKLRPELYQKYVALEKKIGHTLQMSQKTLPEITGI